MFDQSAVQDWLRVHQQLIEKEAAFSELAMRAATGEISPTQLDEERQKLVGLRMLCTAIYEKAFSKPGRP